jgi:NADH-quinone oxidoreductase subunit F
MRLFVPRIFRVLDPTPCLTLADYFAQGGGEGLIAARLVSPTTIIDTLRESGLRGRGGAGFPTATKWAGVLANSSGAATPVVINAAEGEPSTFKDHAILRSNPYRVLEGALIACVVFQATELAICLKRTFIEEWDRVTQAVTEFGSEGWLTGINIRYVAGPSSYLFGEETALLEVISGRHPFPRVTPPWRRGLDASHDGSALAELAGTEDQQGTPALVNNVETFANVALIVRNGPDWFRSIGTQESPGSIVCTVTGSSSTSGVGEFEMGTPLYEVLDDLGGGALPGKHIIGVLPGASSAFVIDEDFDTPLTYESFAEIGSGLGSAGFWCVDDTDDRVTFAHDVSRFLSTESCGQCTPCKDDGIAVTQLLSGSPAITNDLLTQVDARLATIVDGARCSLATQQQVVIRSLMNLIPRPGDSQFEPATQQPSVPPVHLLFAPLLDIAGSTARVDDEHQSKHPDWSFDAVDSGEYPVQRLQHIQPASTELSETSAASPISPPS